MISYAFRPKPLNTMPITCNHALCRDACRGGRKGYDEQDYRLAIHEAGSVRGAAKILRVNRKTVKEMAQIHEINVPSCHGVPGRECP